MTSAISAAMDAAVRMTLIWSVAPAESRAIAAVLQGLMVAARAEPGCLGCSFSTDMDSQVLIRYVEHWKTEADLVRQLRSDRFAVLAELMERASQRPLVEFMFPGATRGLDYVEEVRWGGPRS